MYLLNLSESYYLKQGFCRQNPDRSCSIFFHSDSLCLLIGIFRPFKFNLITDIIELLSTTCVAALHSLYLFFLKNLFPFLFLPSLVLIGNFI